jgi:hypothetical protein
MSGAKPKTTKAARRAAIRPRIPTRKHLYVILLEPGAARNAKFKEMNPDYDGKASCLYVGRSIHDPETRFLQHKTGKKAARIVKRFGVRVLTKRCRQPLVLDTRSLDAKERRLADRLRKEGFGVYQH